MRVIGRERKGIILTETEKKNQKVCRIRKKERDGKE